MVMENVILTILMSLYFPMIDSSMRFMMIPR
jgi:hypothetical protein